MAEPRKRKSTATSNFGAGGRESHDATGFYERFRAPELSDDDTVLLPTPVDEPFVVGDSRTLHTVADNSVALVVTSPPYFAGKQYEEELERDGIPASYLEYLQMLTDVFTECVRVLEPGGRIAVNVANLGRKPYRSLSADVIRILQHDLGLLLRGELIWQKAEGASGSCAWGSYRSAANPVLRDITERVVIASKGRFDRARKPAQRAKQGLPHRNTIGADDFLSLTLDVWQMPTESAKRVGHPAPFPVELPEQLIRLYTYEHDLVLDPFLGSGSTAVAAARLGRRYIGYDLDPKYVAIARQRVADDAGAPPTAADGLGQLCERALSSAGLSVAKRDRRVADAGLVVPFECTDTAGGMWWFELAGAATTYRGGLLRNDTVWRTLGRTAALRAARPDVPVVVLTSQLPKPGSEADQALRAVLGSAAGPADIIDVRSADDVDRLRQLVTPR